MNLVFLNGPPRAGKSTVGEILYINFAAIHLETSLEIGERTIALFKAPGDHQSYKDIKDTPHPDFEGLTFRQAQIFVAESLRDRLGKDIFTKWLVQRIKNYAKEFAMLKTFAVSGVGFNDEMGPYEELAPKKDWIIIRIRRPGHDFNRDSRNYITLEGPTYIDISNTGDLADLEKKVKDKVSKFLV